MIGLVYVAKPSIAVIILWSSNSKASLRMQAMPLWLGEHCARFSPSDMLWFTCLYQSRKIQFAQYLKYTIIAID